MSTARHRSIASRPGDDAGGVAAGGGTCCHMRHIGLCQEDMSVCPPSTMPAVPPGILVDAGDLALEP